MKRPAKNRRRRWLQFTVRGLILLMLLVAVGTYWVRNEIIRAREQRLAVKRIQQLGGSVTFHYEYTKNGQPKANAMPPGPRWLNRMLGENIFLIPRAVTLNQRLRKRFDMQLIAAFDELTELKLSTLGWTSRPEIGDGGLKHLAGMAQLRHLDLESTNLNNTGLFELQHLENLESLRIGHTQISGDGLRYLSAMTQLKVLDVRSTALTDESLQHLNGLENLIDLNLGATPITDTGLANLGDMPALQDLEMRGTQVTQAGLKHIARMKQLRSLSVGREVLNGPELSELAALRNLRSLDLHNLDEAGWDSLAALTQITTIHLDWTRTNDDNVLQLVNNMPQLIELSLAGTDITDRSLPTLGRLEYLQVVDLDATDVTPAAVAELQQLRPKLQIIQQ